MADIIHFKKKGIQANFISNIETICREASNLCELFHTGTDLLFLIARIELHNKRSKTNDQNT